MKVVPPPSTRWRCCAENNLNAPEYTELDQVKVSASQATHFTFLNAAVFLNTSGFRSGTPPRFPSRACQRQCATIRLRAPKSRGNSGTIGANRKYLGNTSGKALVNDPHWGTFTYPFLSRSSGAFCVEDSGLPAIQ
ncbi:hypothetical protein GDO81_024748 [Engystomops pustulosus]|uniref:Uncharacterized protein n=1 Tax=Engystomops pustulosus TaxID=76066 RepID=A0AAV6YQ60_ENGPU|nr:hypothetical protein GDO81_024748 [Engystomops pustulosus]